ncbi:RNAse R [Sinobacterium caligoides]|uniref:Ribonuclease R n=1 Tax=Sinobacterium caligoides TaxID=933926 RepID=A0A3N2DPN8_9GAMM|nr:ribonuclease R [Sinobacterium caligoides]ROS01662.1 RNAse R [Sinobacterium caligoides]
MATSQDKAKTKVVDPHAEREADKYSNPVPSREYILEHLKSFPEGRRHLELAEDFALEDEDSIEAIRRRLRAMERDGQAVRIHKGRYVPIESVPIVIGRVQGHRDGFGFLVPEDGSKDLFLHNRQMDWVFDGDVVKVRDSGHAYKGKREGQIVEVIERNTEVLVGRYFRRGKAGFVVPDNARICHEITVRPELSAGAEDGQYVQVKIVEHPAPHRSPEGEVLEIMGDYMAPGMEIEVAIRSHDIPHEWPQEVLDEIASLGAEVEEQDKVHRIDLRDKHFVTIDGEDARDFDDAVLAERNEEGGWRLWVAIADVSHYVTPGSALDEEAVNRATSVYFPENVIPMLPEVISNGLCSLMPEVDRLCMVCEMTISESGKLTGYTFFEAVMHSHARLTYNQVGAMLDSNSRKRDKLRERYRGVVEDIDTLNELYQALLAQRQQRGAIEFDTVETKLLFDEQRKVKQIVPVHRNDAHRLIEECMLCANVAAARFLEKHELPALYRVHQGPKEKKLESLRQYLGELGLNLGGGDKPTPSDYQKLLAETAERPDALVVQTMLLRSMSQAVYQPENEGHFGLNYPAYSHFTSPIRRYPDLLTHRAIRYVMRSKVSEHVRPVAGATPLAASEIYPYDMAKMLVLGEQCSMAERRADEATRDVMSWLKCEYLSDHVGDTFSGVISAVTGFGLFVELTDIYVEGLVHITALDKDYYQYDQAKQRLIGERSRVSYQLGDELVVQVARVDMEERKIHLCMAGQEASGEAKSPRWTDEGDAPKKRRKAAGKGRGRSTDDRIARAKQSAEGETTERPARQPRKRSVKQDSIVEDKAERPVRQPRKRPAKRERVAEESAQPRRVEAKPVAKPKLKRKRRTVRSMAKKFMSTLRGDE